MKKLLFSFALSLMAFSACANPSRPAEAQKPDSVLLKEWSGRIGQAYAKLQNDNLSEAEQEAALKQVSDLVLQCCSENMDRLFPGEILKQTIYFVDKAEMVKIAEKNPRFLQEGPMAHNKERILMWKNQLKGAPVTDLVMNDTTGVERHLKEMIVPGHYTLIDFWASWCGPCRREMPAVKRVYERFHERGFDIIGVSFDQARGPWLNAIRTVAGGLPWQHISDLKGWNSEGSSKYGVNSIPCTLLVGPDGKIVANGLGGEELGKFLETHLK